MFTTYILQSHRDSSYYVGSTKNFEKRIIEHNKGYSKYTKNKGPFKLIYREEYKTLSEAKKKSTI